MDSYAKIGAVIIAAIVYIVLIMGAHDANMDANVWTVDAECPSEDSCYADYYDGAWHIVRDSP